MLNPKDIKLEIYICRPWVKHSDIKLETNHCLPFLILLSHWKLHSTQHTYHPTTYKMNLEISLLAQISLGLLFLCSLITQYVRRSGRKQPPGTDLICAELCIRPFNSSLLGPRGHDFCVGHDNAHQKGLWSHQRKTTDWERLEIPSRKLDIPREHFIQRWAR